MSDIEVLEIGADGSFDLSNADNRCPAKNSKPSAELPVPKIELEPSTYKVLTDTATGKHSVLVRLNEMEQGKGVRLFEGYLLVDTSERSVRVDLGNLSDVKGVGKCTIYHTYMHIPLLGRS